MPWLVFSVYRVLLTVKFLRSFWGQRIFQFLIALCLENVSEKNIHLNLSAVICPGISYSCICPISVCRSWTGPGCCSWGDAWPLRHHILHISPMTAVDKSWEINLSESIWIVEILRSWQHLGAMPLHILKDPNVLFLG